MFGTGLLKGLGVTMKHFAETFIDDRKPMPKAATQTASSPNMGGVLSTSRSPKRAAHHPVPGREAASAGALPLYPHAAVGYGEGRPPVACGICAKVCPPQCIWIVRDSDENGKPVTRPAEFFIDAAVCMSCSFCVEFCPFDAIKMNHDYERPSTTAIRSLSMTSEEPDRAAGVLRSDVAGAVRRRAGGSPARPKRKNAPRPRPRLRRRRRALGQQVRR